ncbi:hypothetical protein AOQ84DRAFT_368942 [Glonium stellatum]|uniref:Uncharacterized protein n=1 Tax=Glonium stellatum TaxID=574774 RepID=A0A8E2EQE8_9PEZI|nr:hypothetical protein AOQ84DRAFT_368942 [Glonium stellatum]
MTHRNRGLHKLAQLAPSYAAGRERYRKGPEQRPFLLPSSRQSQNQKQDETSNSGPTAPTSVERGSRGREGVEKGRRTQPPSMPPDALAMGTEDATRSTFAARRGSAETTPASAQPQSPQ